MQPQAELRQRKKNQEEETPYISESFTKRIKQLDVYTKIDDDYKVQTSGGGWGMLPLRTIYKISLSLVSLVSLVIMVILLYYEILDYTALQRRDRLTVDRLSQEKMSISFNISFYEIPCNHVDLDVMDISGQQQMGVTSRIIKINLDENGQPMESEGSSFFYNQNGKDDIVVNEECGSCYGAGEEDQCCQTCQDIKDAYLKRGWKTEFLDMNAVQCKPKDTPASPKAHSTQDQSQKTMPIVHGCMTWGQLSVTKVAGNFHIAVGHAENRNTRHVHSFGPSDIHKYNVSHHIENLSFGQYIPEVINPLNGKTFIADKLYSQSYYIHVVPTLYKGTKESFISNQYSANDVSRPVTVNAFGQITALPGIFFMYDISPFLHVVTVKSMEFSHFIVRICAVIGGFVAISELVDSILYYTKRT